MVIVNTIAGNLLDAKEKFIAHQVNSVTVKSHGLSKQIARRFPDADIYTRRPRIGNRNRTLFPDTPGTVIDLKSKKEKTILCLVSQWAPGPPGKWSLQYPTLKGIEPDTDKQRELWFRQCLEHLEVMDDLQGTNTDVAIPFGIGCGLARGNWTKYKKMLQESKVSFVIYKLPS